MGNNKNKLVYVDPNNLAGYVSKGVYRDNVTWKPEDLNLSVDIQVVVPDRNNCGDKDYTGKEWMLYIKKKNSFFSGEPFGKDSKGEDKDFFLTNSYTNISYTEIKNNKQGNRELLGVESIDITFDSHFFPQVVIKFTDVRGASLMMPEEADYTNDLQNKKDGNGSKDGYKNFFRSLFQFPYPVFYLTVKGYYGTRETFLLSVEDFKSSFNSESGNFDVTVKFIGHMFGVYSDLPLNYLIIAPYIGSTGNRPNEYWEKKRETGGSFTFPDGTPIPTFIEFLYKFKSIDNAFTEKLKIDRENFGNVKKVIALRNLNEYLEAILSSKESYDKYLYSIFSSEGTSMLFSNENHYVLLSKTGGNISIPKGDYKKIISKYNDYVSKNNNVSIEGDTCLEFYRNISDNSYRNVSYQELRAIENNVYVVKDGEEVSKINIFNGTEEDCSLVFVNDRMRDAVKNGYTYAVVYRKYSNVGEFFDTVKRMTYEIENSIQQNIEENFEEYNDLARSVLGFSPTIENVFRMIYAHIDCYMHEFYNTLSNVGKQRDLRYLSMINPSVDRRDTDVKGIENFSLPPYTGFYHRDAKTNLRTKKYPYEYRVANGPLAEVSFVESIYEGINGLSSIYEELKPENNVPINFEAHDFTPLLPLDIIYNGHNPYYCLSQENRQEFLPEIVRVFTHRVCLGLETKNIVNKKEKYITNNGKSVSDIEKSNILRSLSLASKKRLYDELNNFLNEENGDRNRRAKIVSYLEDKTLNFKLENRDTAPGAFRTLMLKDGQNLVLNSYDIRKKLINDSGETNSEIKKVCDVYHSLPIEEFTELSADALYKYYGVEINNWEFPNMPFAMGLLHYDKKLKAYNKNIYGGKQDYSTLVNNAMNGTIPTDELMMGLVFYGTCSKRYNAAPPNVKNLYFEKDYLAEIDKKFTDENLPSIPYKRAEIFLSCLIGNNDKSHSYIDEKSGIVRMPKFVRLFLGSQVYFKEISINDEGFFNNFVKSADKLNGRSLGEIMLFYSTVEDEFVEWVNTDFKKIDSLLQKYSTEDYSEEKNIGNWNIKNWYSPEKTFELQQALVNFYLSNSLVMNTYSVSKQEKNNTVEFLPANVLSMLRELYKELQSDSEVTGEIEDVDNAQNNVSPDEVERLKEEIYYTQKGLYDKWLSTFNEDRFLLQAPDIDRDIASKKSNGQKVTGKVTEYNSYVFMDSFYNNIGETFFVDANILYRLLSEQIGEAEVRANRSVYQFISDIAQENKLLLIALPVYNNFHNKDTIVDIFTPHQIYDGSGSAGQREVGNTYVLMYTHEVSHNLDPGEDRENGVKFEDDGFDFADTLGDITQEAIDTFCGSDSLEKYTIPAFGVTYAKQNQSYFKSISLNMENPRQTDFAIYNQFAIAAQEAHGDVNSPVAVGQNMFSIYSNRAYDCHVEMMGCINIMPMMYFQLNNIPLFKGAYMITKVEHHIKAGDMTTKFSGTRISKNAIPYLKCAINVEEMAERLNGGVKWEEPEVVVIGGEENNIAITTPAAKEVPNTKFSKWFTLNELVHSDTADANPKKYPEQYNIKQEIKDHLKELAYFLDGLRDYLGYGIIITSGYRCKALNTAVSGVSNSVHMTGWAADIKPSKGVSFEEFKDAVIKYCASHLEKNIIDFDQCIWEQNKRGSKWMHIGVRHEGKEPHRGQILKTLDGGQSYQSYDFEIKDFA